MTRRPDAGFDLAAFAFTSSGVASWLGNWWSEPGLGYSSTVFVSADTNGDGYTDLLYVTPVSGGFDMAVQYNNANPTGPGLTYGGQQWDQTGLTMDMTSFLPEF